MKIILPIILLLLSYFAKAQVPIYMKIREVKTVAINQSPIANAGVDQVITWPVNSVTLTGSGFDPDGLIASYSWALFSGPPGSTIVSPNSATTNVNGLVAGQYIFTLTVTDTTGLIGQDDIQVDVNAAINQLPTASAGPNLTITLPKNDTTLVGSGSDNDGTISSYSWVQLPGGPSTATIGTPNAATTTVSNLVAGVYWFEITVTDNDGGTAKNTVSVTVNPAIPPANLPPVAKAGNDIIINL